MKTAARSEDNSVQAATSPPESPARPNVSRTTCAAVALFMVGLAGLASIHRTNSSIAARQSKAEDAATPFEMQLVQRPRVRRMTVTEEECTLANTDLLLPMHPKDMPFAATLFKSIEMNLPCFKDLVIVVPPESRDQLAAVVPTWAKVYIVPEPLPQPFGYLSQQVIKLYADKFTTGDNVLILETDMVFKGWKDECYFTKDGKFRIYCVDFEHDKADPIWKKGTEHAIWREVTHDCVVNTPFMFPREVFSALRNWITFVHKKSFEEFMEDYYEGHSGAWSADLNLFSEFNILNHYMLYFMEYQVQMIKTTDPEWVDIDQCSSHTGQLVHRNYDLENPKLTNEYFTLAHEAMKRPMEHHEMPLDLSH